MLNAWFLKRIAAILKTTPLVPVASGIHSINLYIALKCVPGSLIDNESTLVDAMALYRHTTNMSSNNGDQHCSRHMASPGRNTLIVIQRMNKTFSKGWYKSHSGNAVCHRTQSTYKDILIHGATKHLISMRDEAITQRINSDKLESSSWFRKPVEPMTSRHM